jgi:hypothetical protein
VSSGGGLIGSLRLFQHEGGKNAADKKKGGPKGRLVH